MENKASWLFDGFAIALSLASIALNAATIQSIEKIKKANSVAISVSEMWKTELASRRSQESVLRELPLI